MKLVQALHKIKTLLFVVMVFLFVRPGRAGELNGINKENPFAVLNNLEKSFNQLAFKSKIKERIIPLSEPLIKVSEAPIVKSIPTEKVASEMLPQLSTDPTRINQVDINQPGFAITGPVSNNQNQSALPLPLARVIPEVRGRESGNLPKESPLTGPLSSQEFDTIPQLSPQNTRFGKDKYDQEKLFKDEKAKPASLAPSGTTMMNSYPNSFAPQEIATQEEEIKQKEKEQKEKEAREKLDKVILEYAERTEEKSAFNLVDYYDLKGLVSEHQELLGKIQDDEFDERFIKNARVIYERFGTKDNSEDKEPFENFLRRMQPPPKPFRPGESLRKSLPRNRDTHRDQEFSQEESKRSPQIR